jgi:hypothetical protein
MINTNTIAILSASATLLLTGCNPPLGSKADVSALLKSADSSTLEMRYGKTGSGKIYSRRVQYGQRETQQIVAALLGGKRDKGVYDTPVSLHSIKFYLASNCIAEAATCSDLFLFRGRQYRDESGTLSKLVDSPLDSAQEMEEKTPEPGTQGDGLKPAP